MNKISIEEKLDTLKMFFLLDNFDIFIIQTTNIKGYSKINLKNISSLRKLIRLGIITKYKENGDKELDIGNTVILTKPIINYINFSQDNSLRVLLIHIINSLVENIKSDESLLNIINHIKRLEKSDE